MNIKKPLLLIPIGVICLASCNAAKRYSPERYRLSLNWDTTYNFNILQLSDLHMSTLTDREKHYNFMEETVKMANNTLKERNLGKVNLIVVTGDIFTFADKNVARDVFSFFDSLKTPWTVTFGNHDEQCYFSIEWLTSYLNTLNDKRTEGNSYCVFTDLQDDDVFGNANFVIDLDVLKGTTAKTKESIFIFDSNRYNYGEYAGYDYIHNDQIDWYKREVLDGLTRSYTGGYINSLAFFHIPFPEFEEKYKIAKEDEIKEAKSQKVSFRKDPITEEVRDKHEKPGATTGDPKINTHLYDEFCKFNTNGVFIGHNHNSSYIIDDKTTTTYSGKPITLGFGVKSTDRIYADEDMLGGQIISLNKDDAHQGEFDVYAITHKYAQ